MSEYDSSNQPVSVVTFVVVVILNFLLFRLLLINHCTDLLQIFLWIVVRWTPTKFVKIGVLLLFFHGIMDSFVQFLDKIFYKITDQK